MLPISLLLSSLALLGKTVSAVDASANTNVALYWGQNSAGGQNTQESLATYCQDYSTDIVVLSFLNVFNGPGNLPEVNFGPSCGGPYFPGSSLESCPNIGDDIKTCQALGKTVLLSLGGAIGDYGFSTDAQAKDFADKLWNLFGAGESTTRPFGDAIVDGFDLDIENGNPTGYAALVNELRAKYATDKSKPYYISGAPICTLSSEDLSQAITGSLFDFIFVQFYNNVCGIQSWEAKNANPAFNYADWDQFITTESKNKQAKIYLGVPGAQGAATTGYEPAATVVQAAQYLQKNYPSFGGVMIWDASQAFNNVEATKKRATGLNFAQEVKDGLLADEVASTTSAAASSTSSGNGVSSVSDLGSQTGLLAIAVPTYQNSTTSATSTSADPTSADPTVTSDPTVIADPTVTAFTTSQVINKETVVETITSCTGSNVVSCHYVTKTYVTSSSSTPSIKYETKVVSYTSNGEVFVTTTVCPLTEASSTPTQAATAYETKLVTLTSNGEVFVTTTVCPLTETSAQAPAVTGSIESASEAESTTVQYVTEEVVVTISGQLSTVETVAPVETGSAAGTGVAEVEAATSVPFAESTGSASILSASIFSIIAAGIAMLI